MKVLLCQLFFSWSLLVLGQDDQTDDNTDFSFKQTLFYHDNFHLFQHDEDIQPPANATPTPKKPMKDYKKYFAAQLVDHFNRENGHLWNQPYYVDLSRMKNNASPIFFEISGEWNVEKFFNISKTPFGGMFTFDLAKKYHAGMVGLQHRYYAPDAIPFPNGTLAYLSSLQALADAAYFLQTVIRGELNLTGPIFVSGCSYGGTLAVWFRRKYPHVVAGAIARSPPLFAKVDLPDYTIHVEQIARKIYPRCLRDMDRQIPMVKKMVANQPEEFLRHFKICEGSNYTAEQILEKVMLHYTSQFMTFAQQGYNSTKSGRNLIGDKFCPLVSYGDIHSALKSVLLFLYEDYKCPKDMYLTSSCLDLHVLFNVTLRKELCNPKPDWKYSAMWDWQKCTEFGWFMTVPNKERSVLKFLTVAEHLEYFCYNATVESVQTLVDHTNAIYGAWNMAGASNLVIIDGEYDPWRPLSVAPTRYFNPNGVSSILIEGANHCPRVYPIVEKALNHWLHKS